MEQIKFTIGDEIDYIDPAVKQWVGPAEIKEIIFVNYGQFFLYVIDDGSFCCALSDKELRVRGENTESEFVEDWTESGYGDEDDE
jgi:hypothetical protein